MPEREIPTFMVEDGHLRYLNFEGREGIYNAKGQRSFCVDLDEDVAQQMLADGWNVRYTKAQEDGEEGIPYVNVAVGYKIRPPRIVLMTDRARTVLDEDAVEILDGVNIKTVDLIARGREYEPGKLKAYLQSMYITIDEDYLEKKYAIDEPED